MEKGEKWIKRKFFLKSLPNLNEAVKEMWQRYYLLRKNGINLRLQKVNDRYELERMSEETNLTRNKVTVQISKEEFDLLKQLSKEKVQRDSYLLSGIPKIWIMVYHDKFEGLGRIEVQFESEEEATKFKPLDWFGKEITGTQLEKEDSLLELSQEQFQILLAEYSK